MKIISTKTRRAPCQEVVISGEDVDLNMFPVMKCWPDDAGRFITLPLVVTKDPETGIRNVGTYRMQIFDDKTTGMHWQTHKVGAQHYQDSNKSFGVGIYLSRDINYLAAIFCRSSYFTQGGLLIKCPENG